jgi:trigger factor
MEIGFEKKEDLSAEIKISVVPADYTESVEKALKSLKNKVNVPGFRPGMVPVGMIKKLYGKAVLSDEIGKVTTDALFKYLDENKIGYLGQPLPSLSKNETIDWDHQQEFVFYYDLGLSPVFEMQMPSDAFTSYQVEVGDDVLEKEITKLRERNGRNINPDIVEEKDFVMGTATELIAPGEVKEGGVSKTIYVFSEKIEDDAMKSQIIGAKVGDVLELDVKKLYKDDVTAGIYLGVKSEEVADLSNLFRLEITTINRMVPAEMDTEFYDKVFGPGTVTTEEEFKEKLRGFLKNDLQSESNAMLLNSIRKGILDANQFELPDSFLKRWLKVKNEDNKKVDVEEIINDYDNNKQYIRWEILRNKIVSKYEVDLEEGELMDAARVDVMNRVTRMGYQLPPERIDEFAKTLLSNQEEADKLVNGILETKALRKIREEANIVESTIGYDEYLALLEKNTEQPVGQL